MAKICPQCNKEWPDEFKACPLDGTPLVSKPQHTASFSLNLGDANAISGGVNMSDNHSVTNNTNTVNNVTNHVVERPKTERELLDEKRQKYLKACQKAYADEILEAREMLELQNLRDELGLDRSLAEEILEEVRKNVVNNRVLSGLSTRGKCHLNQLIKGISDNEVNTIKSSLDGLKTFAEKYSFEGLQINYHLALAAIEPEKCISKKQSSRTDNYWLDFWTYIAYCKLDKFQEARDLLDSLERFRNYPEENTVILYLVGKVIDGKTNEALSLLDFIEGQYSQELSPLFEAVCLLADPIMAKEIGVSKQTRAFYLEHVLQTSAARKEAQEKAKLEAERKRAEDEQLKMEAEAKRKAEEERIRREKEEAQRRELERKRAEEERLKREAEAKRKAEEEQKKAAAEAAKIHSYLVVGKDKHPLRIGDYIVGRSSEDHPSDIQIFGDQSVSRRSIKISVRKSGNSATYQLEVLKAANPVKVNNESIPLGQTKKLSVGDSITLGYTTIKLEK